MSTIVKGSDRKLKIIIQTKSKEPLNLTNCTALVASFPGEDGEPVSRSLADDQIEILEPKGAGIIEITLSKEFTETLRANERQDFQLELTIGGSLIIHIFESVLTVKSRLRA